LAEDKQVVSTGRPGSNQALHLTVAFGARR
jgi:hypothetical protein